VHSYEQFGEDFARHLNGMFAIALWDSKQKKLLLARDRMGIKPLHYTLRDHSLYFASELKAILQAAVPRAVSLESLYAILNLGYVPGTGTLIEGIHKLPPSTFLAFQNGEARTESYWKVPSLNPVSADEELVSKLRPALEEAIRDQMVADVPVGCFLSGGLDSVSGDSGLFYKIGDKIFYGTMARLFGEVRESHTLRDDKRTWVFPREHVEVLTSTDLTQHGAKVAWAPVRALYMHETDKDMYDIRLKGGRRIKVTGDHSVFKVKFSHRTLTGRAVPARSLKKGDRLFVATEAALGQVDSSKLTADQLDFLTLAGLYTADGSLSKDGRHISIAAGNDLEIVRFLRDFGRKRVPRDLNITDKIAVELQSSEYSHNAVRRLSEKYGCSRDLVYVAKWRKLNKPISLKSHRFAIFVSEKGDVNFSSRKLADWLRKKGFAGNSYTKRVPEWCFTASDYEVAAYLRGYFSGDGSAFRVNGVRPVVSCASVNKNLLMDVRTLLTRLGIYGVISGPQKPGRTSYERSSMTFSLTINRIESLRRFREKVGFLQHRKNRYLLSLKGGRKAYPLTSATIQSIRCLPRRVRPVYDLQVEGTQRFIANGVLCHNTSTIVAYASKSSTQPLKTFCMGFGEDTDEFRDARVIAERFGTDHHELTVDSSQGMKLYPKMIWHMEAPKYNLYPWFVCELVGKFVKVCLSGNGGDEIFAGYYARYENALRIQRLAKNRFTHLLRTAGPALGAFARGVKSKNRLRVLGALGDNTAEYMILAGVLPDSLNQALFKEFRGPARQVSEQYAPFFKGQDFLQGLMNAELRTKLVDDLLSVDDTMSMAHSVELRVPLLDNRIVELMAPVPWPMKYAPGTHGKLLLRKAVQNVLPEETLRKPKWGFSVNVQAWFKGEVGELAKQILPESEIMEKYFRTDGIRKLLATTTDSERDRRQQILLWQLLGFHFWHRIFIDSDRVDAARLRIEALVA